MGRDQSSRVCGGLRAVGLGFIILTPFRLQGGALPRVRSKQQDPTLSGPLLVSLTRAQRTALASLSLQPPQSQSLRSSSEQVRECELCKGARVRLTASTLRLQGYSSAWDQRHVETD